MVRINKSGLLAVLSLLCFFAINVSAQYTITGYNNASWGGVGGANDIIAANSSGYVAMTASTCPNDTGMKYAAVYQGKIFNGCLDECGDANPGGHGTASVIDWTSAASWANVTIYSNLHHTGIWCEASGPYAQTLVFWIKGAVGGEQTKFKLAVAYSNNSVSSNSITIPTAVTTAWKQIVIPWSTFVPPAGAGNPVGIAFSGWQSGKVTMFLDQAYTSKHIPLATAVENGIVNHRNTNIAPAIGLINGSSLKSADGRVYDFTGRQVNISKIANRSAEAKVFVVDRR